MKTLLLLAVTLMLTTSIAGDDKEESKALDGTWRPATAEIAGKPMPEQIVKSIKLILKDDRYTALVGEQKDEGTVKRDTSKRPRTMDITSTQGRTMLAIYKLNGDTLTVCYDLSGKEYPKEFKTKPQSQLYLVEYKRDKP